MKKKKITDITRPNRNTLAAKKILEENFGNLRKGLEAIEKIKLEDAASKALHKLRQQTQSLQLKLQQDKNTKAVTNSLTGAVRKQRFKTPEITNKLANLITGKDTSYEKKTKVEILPDGRKRHHILFKPKYEPDEYLVMDFMWDNNIDDIFGLIKFYKNNKKRYEPKDWDDLTNVLRSLNFKPQEVLNYSISKIQTKERFLEHRLYRRIKSNETYALRTFIEIYSKHLKSKLPFKSFFGSKDLNNWCHEEDIYFNSEENCRVNKDLLVNAWNKINPKDKVIDRKKKK
tara:strand:- start:571 stop:1431 length:861 start_codon:yes stop_codon:yes gene_type:complete